MCGVLLTQNYSDKKTFEDSLNTIKSRGPDFSAVCEKKEIETLLGHNRLIIQDRDARAHQPFEYGDYSLIYNGEIFNFVELREDLINSGVEFTTSSDTEVLLKSWLHWGENCLHKFNGMWAFAIVNIKTGDIFASRDRFGIKPLYFFNQDFFALSSEVKAIHSLLGVDAPMNKKFLKGILNGDPSPYGSNETWLKDVFSIPAGSNLIKKCDDVKIEKWYVLRRKKIVDSIDAQAEHLRELLVDACRIRLRSDVPVGTCLSGGVDSGGILSIMSKKIGSDDLVNFVQKAFNVAFPNSSICEEDLAKIVARDNNVDLNVVRMEQPDIKDLEDYMETFDGPSHSLAFYPIHKLYEKISKQGVKVTLDGQGPDEMLGGYDVFREVILSNIIKKRYSRALAALCSSISHSHEGFFRGSLKAFKTLLYILLGKRMRLWLKKILKREGCGGAPR